MKRPTVQGPERSSRVGRTTAPSASVVENERGAGGSSEYIVRQRSDLGDDMKLNELNADEQTLFLGLMREIVTADGEYSDEERAETGAIETEMGADAFLSAMTHAKDKFHSRTDIMEAAKKITRVDAQKVIIDRLIHIASSDGVDDAEEKPLRWLANAWPDAVLK